jgi:hypothetical protein
LRKEERGGIYNRNVSASRSEQTVLVETGRGEFHTEVGKLQADINARVRAGIITSQSELIQATRDAYALAAQTTGAQVDPQALDRAIVSNLATLSESSSQTHSELKAQGATEADYDAQISSAEHAFVDPSPPPPVDPASELAQASGVTTSSDGSINQSSVATNKSPVNEKYEASAAANLIVLAIAAYFVYPVLVAGGEAVLPEAAEAGEEAVCYRIAKEVSEQVVEQVKIRIGETEEEEIVEEVVKELPKQLARPSPF